jgi:hypothetical protein
MTTYLVLISNNFKTDYLDSYFLASVFKIFDYQGNFQLFFMNIIAFSTLAFYFLKLISRYVNKTFRTSTKTYLFVVFFTLLINFLFKEFSGLTIALGLFLGPVLMLWLVIVYYQSSGIFSSLLQAIQYFRKATGKAYRIYLILSFTSMILFLILQTPLLGFYISITKWNIYVSAAQLSLITNIFNIGRLF